ncbi:hopanoid biosynthesis-associated protein HpnK [Sphingomonas sp. AR_OL41]|uniref:hopanoid biosynthesis-associated protein HpnK n=1 Tax=Sphingomonas sp. AR_OL41 TaxID=3042729 RepID=UPI0024816B5C|nr:hopanoid biosynthesis-associated protein HpnK [Sphingomonas sp. AR_OL41]MDH7975651.1 hopanoid biosynthesis-associated protein HpnK [Sphingomonas sp. AR_OL41]
MKTLIVTADDFGASVAVNEAVERAHVDGILTAASLMVAGDAAPDAVARARRLPTLGVGLHLVLVEGRPALPPDQVSELVDATGHFRTDLVMSAVNMTFNPRARRQLAAEIEAQFAAFAATGLPLDHVNAHKHFHLHPVIASLVLKIGKGHGMRAARAPVEPRAIIAAIEPDRAPRRDPASLWAKLVRRRFVRADIAVPEQVFGLAWTGAMDTARMRGLIAALPDGVSEIYTHPATHDDWPGHAPGYRYADELAALLDARALVREQGITLARFADLAVRR